MLFFKKNSENELYHLGKIKHVSIILLVIFEIIIFKVFRNYETIEDIKISDSILSLLRNELSVSNSYSMSKTLSDIESVGLFKCARLTEKMTDRVFYDTILGKRCDKSWLFNTSLKSTILRGLNGTSYELTYASNLNKFALYFEILLYILLIILGYIVPDFLVKRIRYEKLKVVALELDRKKIKETAEQISHDIASPLSAIKMLVSLLPNLDIEIKNLLAKAVDRTQEIFDDLKNSNTSSSKIFIRKCIDELIKEKHIVWGIKCRIELDISSSDELVGLGDEVAFKRSMSNLINNSFEASQLDENNLIKISVNSFESFLEIRIVDHGFGMSPETLSQLGLRGFSSGKTEIANSGSGLGIHYAKSMIKSWGGYLSFESSPDLGTTVIIKLQKFKNC